MLITFENAIRLSDPAGLAQFASSFPAVDLFTVEAAFKSWSKARADHFGDGGSFDRVYNAR